MRETKHFQAKKRISKHSRIFFYICFAKNAKFLLKKIRKRNYNYDIINRLRNVFLIWCVQAIAYNDFTQLCFQCPNIRKLQSKFTKKNVC